MPRSTTAARAAVPQTICQTERAQLETERERIEQMKLSLYPDWKAGDISREEYHRLKEQFEQQQAKLDTRLASLQSRIDEVQNSMRTNTN